MKGFLVLCSSLLFIAIFNLPIGYYTFLRIVITIGAVIVLYNEIKIENNLWVLIFGIILVLFNPLIPIYLHQKSIWVPIDFLAGCLFLIKAFTFKNLRNE